MLQGVDSAVPKAILDLMQVDGLTRENVASHLQKHRIQLKKREHEHAVHQAQAAVPACLDFAKWFAGKHTLSPVFSVVLIMQILHVRVVV